MKKFLLLLTLFLSILLPQGAFAISASPNNDSYMKIIDPGNEERTLPFSTYNINDYNYFKLRTLANYMNHTVKKFDVKYDEGKDAVFISTGKKYADYDALEIVKKIYGDKEAYETRQKIFIDGKEIKIAGYNIDGNNYFKLRDLGAALDFMVDYDSKDKCIIINPQLSSGEKGKTTSEITPKAEENRALSGEILGAENSFVTSLPAEAQES